MSSATSEDIPAPTVGALTRLAWLKFRERLYAHIVARGYTDVPPSHVMLFRYPTIANVRPTVLAEQMGLSKQAMNDVCRQLERSGYIELRPDPEDGRARLITLTPRGEELLLDVRAAATEAAEEWERALGKKRFEAFHKALLDLVDLT
jgi:DNA-binding MarR family transcriptional regulator